MPNSNIIAYHHRREREELALAVATERPQMREMHLELARLHAMLGCKWSVHLAPAREV